MISTFGWIVFTIVFAGLVADAVHGYYTATGTVWERLLAVGKSSATIMVARLGAIGGFVLNALVEIADLIGSPAISSALTTYVDAKAVGYTLVAAAIVVEWSRRRTLRVEAPTVSQSFMAPTSVELVKVPLVGQPASLEQAWPEKIVEK